MYRKEITRRTSIRLGITSVFSLLGLGTSGKASAHSSGGQNPKQDEKVKNDPKRPVKGATSEIPKQTRKCPSGYPG